MPCVGAEWVTKKKKKSAREKTYLVVFRQYFTTHILLYGILLMPLQ